MNLPILFALVLLNCLVSPISRSWAGVLDALPEPINTQMITISKEITGTGTDATYLDCVEASLLRWVHIMFRDLETPSRVDLHRLRAYTTNSELISYFERFPEIMPNKTYIESQLGQTARNEWGSLLIGKPFVYYRLSSPVPLELNSYIKNLFLFVHHFFPGSRVSKDLEIWEPQARFQAELDSMCDFFSDSELRFDCKIKSMSVEKRSSGEDYRDIIFNISINGTKAYEWKFHDVFLDDKQTDGHSELFPVEGLHYGRLEHSNTDN